MIGMGDKASPSHCHSSTYSSNGDYSPPVDPDAYLYDHLLEDEDEDVTYEYEEVISEDKVGVLGTICEDFAENDITVRSTPAALSS